MTQNGFEKPTKVLLLLLLSVNHCHLIFCCQLFHLPKLSFNYYKYVMLVLYSFHTGQTQVVLFMTAVASLSSLVHKPSLKVHLVSGELFLAFLKVLGA